MAYTSVTEVEDVVVNILIKWSNKLENLTEEMSIDGAINVYEWQQETHVTYLWCQDHKISWQSGTT